MMNVFVLPMKVTGERERERERKRRRKGRERRRERFVNVNKIYMDISFPSLPHLLFIQSFMFRREKVHGTEERILSLSLSLFLFCRERERKELQERLLGEVFESNKQQIWKERKMGKNWKQRERRERRRKEKEKKV